MLADLDRKAKAVQSKDPDAALEILEQETRAQIEQAQQQSTARDQKWSAAVGLFQSGLLPSDLHAELRGKDYGDDPEKAADSFYRDIVAGIEKRTEARLRKELEPVLRKQIAAELAGEEPSPDLAAGSAPARGDNWKTLKEARAAVARMSGAEYARRQTEIDAALERLARSAA